LEPFGEKGYIGEHFGEYFPPDIDAAFTAKKASISMCLEKTNTVYADSQLQRVTIMSVFNHFLISFFQSFNHLIKSFFSNSAMSGAKIKNYLDV
jgi:hypothetical protein